MASDAFDDEVAARTRAAAQILAHDEMLAVFRSVFGAEEDLTAIRDHGRRAEAQNLAQTKAQEGGSLATQRSGTFPCRAWTTPSLAR